jgi:RNA polymerase sigma factor (sigma-70 family)
MLSWGVIEGLEVVAERDAAASAFEDFVATAGARLRVALVARYGVDVGVDACADALAYAWEHWARVSAMANAAGYLYRVGQTSARRQARWRQAPTFPPEHRSDEPNDDHDRSDAGLDHLLATLDDRQRTVVVLAHVYEWTYAEIADLLGVPLSTVRNLMHRGMTKLRRATESDRDH